MPGWQITLIALAAALAAAIIAALLDRARTAHKIHAPPPEAATTPGRAACHHHRLRARPGYRHKSRRVLPKHRTLVPISFLCQPIGEGVRSGCELGGPDGRQP